MLGKDTHSGLHKLRVLWGGLLARRARVSPRRRAWKAWDLVSAVLLQRSGCCRYSADRATNIRSCRLDSPSRYEPPKNYACMLECQRERTASGLFHPFTGGGGDADVVADAAAEKAEATAALPAAMPLVAFAPLQIGRAHV